MLIGPQNLPANVRNVREAIQAALLECGRSVDSVTLLAVSKGQPAESVRAAAAEGIRDFGESYLQEALPKLGQLADLDLTWHFIGQLQSNKTRAVAEHFAWVHGVDRARHAERLAAQRPYHAPPLNVCIQVNVGAEVGKAGVAPGEVAPLAEAIRALPRLRLRGLMCLPPEEHEVARQRHWFALLRREFAALVSSGLEIDTLSMGMSGDFVAAIHEGATIVRIGTALFGPR
ncbi:MAG TPA: YggS family pyridoxal phosphate-dependent enzyme [Steroidobacteraceae bacterium]|nr:YggS family pyridoxal phosphate-dependent enzyme [Steroidobacteraceae bacterium]HNS28330.1 YggS family pyridoxal phosphate-dependent enzyme [Steroidobacteraceae bacterium]